MGAGEENYGSYSWVSCTVLENSCFTSNSGVSHQMGKKTTRISDSKILYPSKNIAALEDEGLW